MLSTFMTTRAIQIEMLESLDTSNFLNTLRRFLALRGSILQPGSDCGTDFVGAWNELEAAAKEMDEDAIRSYLSTELCKWIFNPTHGFHGGVWERMIGVTRRILDSILTEFKPHSRSPHNGNGESHRDSEC